MDIGKHFLGLFEFSFRDEPTRGFWYSPIQGTEESVFYLDVHQKGDWAYQIKTSWQIDGIP